MRSYGILAERLNSQPFTKKQIKRTYPLNLLRKNVLNVSLTGK